MKEIDICLEQFKKGKMSRREFITRLVALGLSIPAVNAILAKSGPGASASTPKKGGRLRAALANHSPKDTLDPAKAMSSIDNNRACILYSTLVRATHELTPEPLLAESWEPNKTADEWIFRLRKGVQFHDGREVRAEDVIYTFRRVLDPKTASYGRPLLTDIDPDELRAEDRYTLRIKLVQPNAELPLFLGGHHAGIVPEGFTDFHNPVGTGAFKYKDFKPGIRFLGERNPDYFISGLPYVDEVENFGISDKVARVNSLLAGEIHYMKDLDARLIDKVKAAPGVQVLSCPSGMHIAFAMNVTAPPYDNPDVRNAIKHLVDREKYLEIVYQGYGTAANDHPVPPFDPMYCDKLPIRQYDPDKAKFLLKKAGALDYTFEWNGTEGLYGSVEGGLVLQQMAAKAGVKIKSVNNPADGYWEAVWKKKPFCAGLWNTRATANMILSLAYHSDAPWNETFWKRPEFDKLLFEARGTLDEAKRKEMYCELQRMVRDDCGALIPAFVSNVDAGSTTLKGVRLHPLRPNEGIFYEKAWLDI